LAHFSALRIVVPRHHIYHATHHKPPAIHHVLVPQIPATPLKNTSKGTLLASGHRAEKKHSFSEIDPT
jgi:hypothetical protein